MALPKSKILSLVKRLELGELTREMTVNEDFLATIKDPNIKEIIAKEKTDLFKLFRGQSLKCHEEDVIRNLFNKFLIQSVKVIL